MNRQVCTVAALPPFEPHQWWQVGGIRYEVISVTGDDQYFDEVLVLRPEDNSEKLVKMATEFLALKPEFVH